MTDEILKVRLGGLRQKVHIKSGDESKPVLLFIHGGPGGPNRHLIMTKHTDLLDSFTLVAYDQRGCGGSFWGCKPKSLTLDRHVDDAGELAAYLCERFGKDKIFAVGGSWGSALGAGFAYRYPDLVAAFVGFGQVVNGAENERVSFEYTLAQAEKAGNQKDIAALKRVGPPVKGAYQHGVRGAMKQRDLLTKYGGYSPNNHDDSYFGHMVREMLAAHEYSFGDLLGLLLGSIIVPLAMMDEISDADLATHCPHFAVPYFIFHGVYDYNTPAPLVEPFLQKITAPHKELVWFEHSGHNPMTDEPEQFESLLREKLLRIAEAEREKGVRV
ncbi:MAG: alpha/beta hydrolase [Oscillospiraceae bacterium]|jgi:pimeloyl-ACP methyl ester carboxylesterase|nr:alpha/beta hydrolase [Oscillospiraceae bacterium]